MFLFSLFLLGQKVLIPLESSSYVTGPFCAHPLMKVIKLPKQVFVVIIVRTHNKENQVRPENFENACRRAGLNQPGDDFASLF